MHYICMGLAAVIATCAPVLGDVRYRVRDAGFLPGGTGTALFGLNNRGAAFGFGSLQLPTQHAVMWEPLSGELVDVGAAACGPIARGAALNDSDNMIVRDYTCQDTWWFVYGDGSRIRIPLYPGYSNMSVGILNNVDMVVATAWNPDEAGRIKYLWSPSSGSSLIDPEQYTLGVAPFDLNDNGWMTGLAYGDGDPCVTYVWSPENGYQDLCYVAGMDGDPTGVSAINNQNQVLGTGRYEGVTRPFIWTPGSGTYWFPIPFTQPTAGGASRSMSENGLVFGSAGYIDDDIGQFVSFWCLWRQGRAPQILGPESIDPCEENWYFRNAVFTQSIAGPNDRGEFVSTITYPPPFPPSRGVILTPYIPGDLDEDGDCDLQDLAYQLSNFGRTGDANYAAGDLDCDQDVDLADLSILLANFGETLP